ncbi:hypothetical protein D9M72_522130 [compost metagenome]
MRFHNVLKSFNGPDVTKRRDRNFSVGSFGQRAFVGPCRFHEVTHSLLDLAVMARRHASVAVGLDHEVGELKRVAIEGEADYPDRIRRKKARSQRHHHGVARVVASRHGSEMEAIKVGDECLPPAGRAMANSDLENDESSNTPPSITEDVKIIIICGDDFSAVLQAQILRNINTNAY